MKPESAGLASGEGAMGYNALTKANERRQIDLDHCSGVMLTAQVADVLDLT